MMAEVRELQGARGWTDATVLDLICNSGDPGLEERVRLALGEAADMEDMLAVESANDPGCNPATSW